MIFLESKVVERDLHSLHLITSCSVLYQSIVPASARSFVFPVPSAGFAIYQERIDSLHYSVSTSNTELHRLLLDCNETEQTVIIRMAKELKATLVSLGI